MTKSLADVVFQFGQCFLKLRELYKTIQIVDRNFFHVPLAMSNVIMYAVILLVVVNPSAAYPKEADLLKVMKHLYNAA